MILVADDMAVALQPGHQRKFCYDVLNHAVEIARHAVLIHALRPDAFYLILAARYF